MRTRNAFTMMEVLIAVLVIGIAIPATLATVAYTIREAGILMRDTSAAVTAKTVLNHPGWGSDWKPINGYEAKREVTPVALPAAPDGSLTVNVDRVEVTVRASGHDAITVTSYEKR